MVLFPNGTFVEDFDVTDVNLCMENVESANGGCEKRPERRVIF